MTVNSFHLMAQYNLLVYQRVAVELFPSNQLSWWQGQTGRAGMGGGGGVKIIKKTYYWLNYWNIFQMKSNSLCECKICTKIFQPGHVWTCSKHTTHAISKLLRSYLGLYTFINVQFLHRYALKLFVNRFIIIIIIFFFFKIYLCLTSKQ